MGIMEAKYMTSESHVLDGCLRYLKVCGIYHWRNNTGAVQIAPGRFMRFGKKGSSDIIGVLPDGRALFVECKSQKGRLSPEQKKFIDDVKNLGCLACCVRGWKELDQILRQEGYISDPLFQGGAL